MKASKLQQAINQISKIDVTGEMFLTVDLKVAGIDLENECENILNLIKIPFGFERSETLISKKDVKIYVFFVNHK